MLPDKAVTPNDLFAAMIISAAKQGLTNQSVWEENCLVGIDPGETTGVSLRYPGPPKQKIYLDQIATPDLEQGMDKLEEFLTSISSWPMIVTIEDYKVYGWKADAHKFAGLHTPQVIGALRRVVHKAPHMTLIIRMAQQAKGWATDEKLKKWGLYDPGMKHARDAERHLITTMFFNQKQNVLNTNG